MEGQGYQLTVNISNPELFPSKRDKNGEETEGKAGQWLAHLGIHLMRARGTPRPDTITELFLSQRTTGTKMEKRLKERRSGDQSNLERISRGGSKAWHYYWYYGVFTDRSITWLSSKRANKLLIEIDVDTYTQQIVWSQEPMQELCEGLEKLKGRATP